MAGARAIRAVLYGIITDTVKLPIVELICPAIEKEVITFAELRGVAVTVFADPGICTVADAVADAVLYTART